MLEGEQSVEQSVSARALGPLVSLFPTVSSVEVWAVLALIPLEKRSWSASGEEWSLPSLISSDTHLITWQGVRLALPYRVYFQEPTPTIEQQLTSQQRQLLACLYLRHHDGFVRQRRLAQLFREDALAAFAIPFTFSLLGDYVQEILEVLEAHLTPALLASYVELIQENPRYWSQTQGRVASYWDVYYRTGRRGAPSFDNYVGSRLLTKLREAVRQATLT
jgi:hypothetical protein